MSKLVLTAPLAGWATSLDEVPDAAFAGRMLGEGLAIDPTGSELRAPCDGEVSVVAAQKHAVTIRTDEGAEILLHVGIDTVQLNGEGFETHVQAGQRVRRGDLLLRFDLDLLAQRAASVITPVVILGERFTVARLACDREVAPGDFLMELAPAAQAEQSSGAISGAEIRAEITIPFEHGLHARPAAALAASLKPFSADVRIQIGARVANARSPTSLMSLGAKKGEQAVLVALGADAAAAIGALQSALQQAVGLDKSEYAPIVQKQTAASADARRISGVIAARGIAAGRAVHLRRAEMVIDEQSQGVDVEQARFDRARREMRERLSSLAVHQRGPRREILEAHLQFLDDPELIAATREGIAQGKSAAVAWQIAVRAQVRALGSLNDARLRERADDLRDVEAQLLAELTGESATLAPELPEHAIVLAKDLLPSQFVALNASRVAGICTAEGGATSHVAILAASMDIPTLVAAGPRILDVPENAELVLDAEQGWLNVSPTPAELQHAKDSVARHRARLAEDLSHAQRECFTSDGVRIHIYANAGSLAEARAAVAHGAEGCGLLRTEFLFLDRATAPDEREQATQYARIAATFGGRPVAIRTLDVGGDKPLRYLPLAAEENPALGVRGIRASLLHPQLLRTQLRAILGAAASGECRILLPMVTDADEIRAVRAMLAELQQEMKLEKRVPLGAMIETPAAALMAEQIAREADFLSIGTNDLTQYTLAVDRGNAALADRLDALHPAVLRLISRVARAAEERRRELAVCGGLASDPEATPILIGLGVRELSMVTAAIPRQKSFIRSLNSVDCAALAREALQLEDAGSVRSLVQRWLAARAAAPVAAMEVSS